MPSRLDLHLEYVKLLSKYRKLAADPSSDGEFRQMQKIASRLDEISERIERRPTVTQQFSSLDEI